MTARERSAMRAAGVRIGAAVEGVRAYLSRSLGLMVVGWCGALTLAVLILASALAGDGGWSAGSPIPLVLALLVLAVIPAGIWRWRRLGGHWCAEHRITRSMDRIAGLEEGAVLGGLELSRKAPPGTSPGLRALALRRVGRKLSGDAKTLSGGVGEQVKARVRRGTIAFAVTLPAALLVMGAAPARTFSAWDGLLNSPRGAGGARTSAGRPRARHGRRRPRRGRRGHRTRAAARQRHPALGRDRAGDAVPRDRASPRGPAPPPFLPSTPRSATGSKPRTARAPPCMSSPPSTPSS